MFLKLTEIPNLPISGLISRKLSLLGLPKNTSIPYCGERVTQSREVDNVIHEPQEEDGR